MKNRSVQAISIGLSAISLASPASMIAYAQEVELVNDAETATEQEVISDSEEKAIAEEVSNLSEQLNTDTIEQLKDAAVALDTDEQFEEQGDEQLEENVDGEKEKESTVKDAVDSVSASVDNIVKTVESVGDSVGNIVKAGEAIGEAQTQAESAVSQVDEVIKSVGETTAAVSDQAEMAVNTIKDQNTSKEAAVVIIADTDKSVEEAKAAFDDAENKYNEAMAAYNLAKSDFDTAMAAYNDNKADATNGLDEAERELVSAQERLEEIQKQLDVTQDELALAGAYALVAAEAGVVTASDDNRGEYMDYYAQAILKYYYLPKIENLTNGERIENFRVEVSYGNFDVEYSIVDKDGTPISEMKSSSYGYFIGDDGRLVLYEAPIFNNTQSRSTKNGLMLKSRSKSNNSLKGTSEISSVAGTNTVKVGSQEWTNLVTEYVGYISWVRAKVVAYNNLLTSVESAKTDFMNAQDKVAEIRQQLDALEGSKDIVSLGEMAKLEAQLESAQLDYADAKEHLESAKASLLDAKSLFNKRFKTVPQIYNPISNNSIAPQTNSVDTSVVEEAEKLEDRIDKEIEGLEKLPSGIIAKADREDISVADVASNDAADKSKSGKNDSKSKIFHPKDVPVVPGEIVTIGEEETPLAITLAGILQHAKWFAGLAVVTIAGAGVSIFEVKRRAAAKIIDKLNQ